ncbi:MAG: beta-eliminating lyase-related protein [Billgrantia sp.]
MVDASSPRPLSYDVPSTCRDALLSLAEYAGDMPMDRHGVGVTEKLEARLCELLGHEAAVFMPSGKAAQNIALKIWSQRRQCNRIAIHPRSHIEEWEAKAYSELFGLHSTKLGAYDRQATLGDLKGIQEPLGAAVIELALRPLGCVTIPLDELRDMADYARSKNIPLHADAARIWEAQPGYGCSLAELAAPFDTLYVSLYKVLRGFAGGALLGPADFIAEARIWQHRLGQKLYRQFPYALAALQGLELMLPRVPALFERACLLAERIAEVEGVVRVNPQKPCTPSFQVIFEASAEEMLKARDLVAEARGIWLFDLPLSSPYQGLTLFEVHIGTSALGMTPDVIIDAIRQFSLELKR